MNISTLTISAFLCFSCSNELIPESTSTCGNNIIDTGEICDDGSLNTDSWSHEKHCNTDCSDWAPYCGDGKTDEHEYCDQGSSNNDQWSLQGNCNTSCSALSSHCGDGIVNTENEICDDGIKDSDHIDESFHCNTTCTEILHEPYCGDGIIDNDHGEECDPHLRLNWQCREFGYNFGLAHCTPQCTMDFSRCNDNPGQLDTLYSDTCYLDTQGKVTCWGDQKYYVYNQPEGTSFTFINVNIYHLSALDIEEPKKG